MSDSHLEIDGTHGKLYATISSNDMEGRNKDYGDVVFANVDLSGIQADGGSVSVSDAKTTLTQTGADAFANFYEAGQELDPLSFTARLGAAVQNPDEATLDEADTSAGSGNSALGLRMRRAIEMTRPSRTGVPVISLTLSKGSSPMVV